MAGNTILGVFVVTRVQKKYPYVSQKGKILLPHPIGGGQGAMAPTAPLLQASLAISLILARMNVTPIPFSRTNIRF